MIGRRRAALALTAWLSALLLWPAGALAQGGSSLLQTSTAASPLTPFSNQAPTTTTATTTPTVATTSTSGGGLTGTDGVAIGIGAIVVLGGISFFIWRDARKRAPIRQRAAAAAVDAGPRQRQKPRKLSPAERKRRKRGRAR